MTPTVESFQITCRKGCGQQINSEQEYDSHDCSVYLVQQLAELDNEEMMLDAHISEAEKDVENSITDFENLKNQKEAEIQDLVQELMKAEKEGETLNKRKLTKAQRYEKRINDEKEQITDVSQQALKQYLSHAKKEFNDFNKKLESDFNKYKEKLKDEGVTYELKTKANLIAKEAERLLTKSGGDVPPRSPAKSYMSTVTSKGGRSPLQTNNA